MTKGKKRDLKTLARDKPGIESIARGASGEALAIYTPKNDLLSSKLGSEFNGFAKVRLAVDLSDRGFVSVMEFLISDVEVRATFISRDELPLL